MAPMPGAPAPAPGAAVPVVESVAAPQQKAEMGIQTFVVFLFTFLC